MEYGIETVAQNPQVITIILVVTFSILTLFALWAVSRLFAGRKGLDKERRVLDTELYKLEKFASMKQKEEMGDKESVAESFWPKQDQGLATAAEEAPAADQLVTAHESQPEAQQADDDEFADIRKENLVRDWSEND